MPASAVKRAATDGIDYERREILDKLGDLSHVEIANNEVLLAIYIRSNRSPSGIYLTDKTVKEDEYQGKVGLVVKIGPACRFQRTNAETGVIYGLDIKLHDWVVVRPSDTWALDLASDPTELNREKFVKCRLAYDDMIRARVPSPGMVW